MAIEPKNVTAGQLLTTDHAELDEMLSGVFTSVETGDPSNIFAHLDLFWARLAMHIRAEHLHLFTALLERFAPATNLSTDDGPSADEVGNMIMRLRNDHEFFMLELAHDVKVLRDLIASRAREPTVRVRLQELSHSLLNLRARIEEHNRIEENGIYPCAAAYLSADQQAQLNQDVRREIEDLPPRFHDPV